MKNKLIICFGVLAAILTARAGGFGKFSETDRDRLAWWTDARFGMFIHWGLYAVPAHGEWYMNHGRIGRTEYEKYGAQFNPTNFDAAAWVRIAKDAGMKYLVITSKHHDGFSMFDTKATDYNIVAATPWHHDPLKDLAEQCRKQGVRFCVYYSIMDWHHPDQAPAKDDLQHPEYNPTKMLPDRKADYVAYMKAQLHELIVQYHPGVIWFDGGWPKWWTEADGRSLYDWLRQQDSALIVNNRVGGAGDYGTPEQNIPANGLKEAWETCMTINDNWGYNAGDKKFKSTETLLRNLVDIASKGGNYLLNVGPTADGIIPEPEVERLHAMGHWMHINGEAIYGTGPSPFWSETNAVTGNKTCTDNGRTLLSRKDWRATTKRGKIYVTVFNWPTNGVLELPGLRSKVTKVYELASHTAVEFALTPTGVSLELPATAPDPIASVICVQIADRVPQVAAASILIDGQKQGRAFDGIGAVSAGASSRLLIDYPEPQRSQILDYLFKPDYGAGIQHLKVEIGGDVNSTDGSEPSHMRARNDENCQRGYEWWLMAEARKRNPKIILDGLEWGAPAWIGSFYSQNNADYIVKFIQGAKREHGLDMDYVGIWNETVYDVEWIKLLRRTLDAAGLQHVGIVAADNNHHPQLGLMPWKIAESVLKDPELASSVAALGAHYPGYQSTPEALATGKPLWSSEDGPWRGDWQGARSLAKTFNRNYVVGKITKTEIWSPVTSYYDNLPVPGSGLMRASEPWSGHYDVQPAVWAAAHTTQFAQPGWSYLDSACQLIPGGSVVAMQSPAAADYTLVIETMDAKEPQLLSFSLANLPAKNLHVWRTDERQQFVQQKDIVVAQNSFLFSAEPNAIYTLTTTTGQAKGNARTPAEAAFPFPYLENFESYSASATPRYFSDQAGAFEVVKRADGKGQALRQVLDSDGIDWHYHPTPPPETFLGSQKWTNYEVSVDAMAEKAGFVSLFGRLGENTSDTNPPTGYWLTASTAGKWELNVAGKGKKTIRIGAGDLDFVPGAWHRLALRFIGNNIGVKVDNRLLAEVTDTNYQAGMTGLGCGWHGAQFDNFSVEPIRQEVSQKQNPLQAHATGNPAGLRQHPRLILNAQDWETLRSRRAHSPELDAILTKAVAKATAMLAEPTVVLKKEGNRFLAARDAQGRIQLLGFVYHLTGEKAFLNRAEKEMLALARLKDWNPSNFLDTAEITAGMALGYDWLFDDLSDDVRKEIRGAIVEKGLGAGLDAQNAWWKTANNNWNQVCLGGLTLGALAVADEAPAPASAMLELAKGNNKNGLRPYAPDGIYPEGPSYWYYGTGYEVMMISALDTALGTDWDLGAAPGFLSSARAQLELTGPSLQSFNFSDGSSRPLFQPWQYWFALKLKEPSLVYFQQPLFASWLAGCTNDTDYRAIPFLANWISRVPSQVPPPAAPLAWHGDGPNPVGVFRTSWTDTNALYLAFKGGQARNNHGHMDAGSFILDAGGVRWAEDLGGQEYYSIESKGWHLWDMAQDSDRWRVFRLNNFSHNTLILGGQLHNVNGRAEIVSFTNDSATVNLTAVFQPQAASVMRHFRFYENKVIIRDEIAGATPGLDVKWQMVTQAAIQTRPGGAVLQRDGKFLRVRVSSAGGGQFQIASARPPDDGVNQPNPGFSILTLKETVPASSNLVIEVEFQPEPAQTAKL